MMPAIRSSTLRSRKSLILLLFYNIIFFLFQSNFQGLNFTFVFSGYTRRANIYVDFVPDVQSLNDRAWRYLDRPAELPAPAIVEEAPPVPEPVRGPPRVGLAPIFNGGQAVLDDAVESDDPDIVGDRLVIDDRDVITDDEFSDDDTEYFSCSSSVRH